MFIAFMFQWAVWVMYKYKKHVIKCQLSNKGYKEKGNKWLENGKGCGWS